MDFDFDDDVPFCWQPENPEFALGMNMLGAWLLGFEKYVISAVRAAASRITDPAVADEADAFLRQEAQHSRAHRLHVRALARQHPGFADLVDKLVAEYDRLFDAKPLEYHLAYIADLEASFTPFFKQLLDHEDELFGPGDDRVASVFLWHFTEEIEHRSSALVLFDHVVDDPWYRLRQLPSVLAHLRRTIAITVEGTNHHIPLADRKVDAGAVLPIRQLRRNLGAKIPILARGIDTTVPGMLDCVPIVERLTTAARLAGAMRPGHDPGHQPLPSFAAEWLERFERGDDVAHWYSSRRAS